MSSMREIKQRISNVSSAKQIIKAMDMVSSTKVHKARAQLEGVRPIHQNLRRIIHELSCIEEIEEHIYFKERKVNNSLYIVFTSNRGLSGSYNSNVVSKALEHMENTKNEKVMVIGSKGVEPMAKNNKNIIKSVTDIADANIYYGSEKFAQWVLDYYLKGEVEEVFLVYTEFESILSYVPKVEKILPIRLEACLKDGDASSYEPNLEDFITHTIDTYLHMSFFRAFSEAHTSEHASRMVNMDAAGKNASDLIDDLKNQYNRKRQTAITQELSEIIGSANILNKGGKHE